MSELSTLARPYAKAAFQHALSASALGQWNDALAAASGIASDARIEKMVGDPRLSDTQLFEIYQVPEAPAGFDNFVKLLVENRRLPLLPHIAEAYAELKAEAEKSIAVTVRSAVAMDESSQQRLREALKQRIERDVDLTVEIDESILGGAVIHAGDLVIDGSLRGKLARMAEALTE